MVFNENRGGTESKIVFMLQRVTHQRSWTSFINHTFLIVHVCFYYVALKRPLAKLGIFMPRHTKYEGHIVFRSVSPSVRLGLRFLVKVVFSEVNVRT